jgi:hypothetical protein
MATLRKEAAGWGEVILGAWLVVVSLLLQAPGLARYATLVSGALIAVCGACSRFSPALQYVQAGLGAWLILGAVGLPQPALLAWHAGLIGAAVLGLSFIPVTGEQRVLRHAPRRARPAVPISRADDLASAEERMDSPPAEPTGSPA